ncbi:MAG: nucleotide exchange factor GrpE [Lachnospiraceae bacterium]|nr:nucleotide exchange factor GrpE [Lachnospiraceae bacterium]
MEEHESVKETDTEKPQNRENKENKEAGEHTESGSHSSSNKALELELEKQKELVEEADDKYKRLLAEFENARNRYERDSKRMYDVGAKDVLEKLLPVVDNFERALLAIPEEDKERAFEQGVDQIYRQLIRTLDEIGVRPMDAEGTEFDPNLHNAVMHVEDEEFGENVVAEELQKGYMYKEDVLRHSMVKVAN